jgi:hypothetical protein
MEYCARARPDWFVCLLQCFAVVMSACEQGKCAQRLAQFVALYEAQVYIIAI